MKDKLGTTHVADTASWLTLIHFPLLPNKILIWFRVAMCPARKLHFPASLATMHDHMTPFWPMRHKWKSIWNLEESSLIKVPLNRLTPAALWPAFSSCLECGKWPRKWGVTLRHKWGAWGQHAQGCWTQVLLGVREPPIQHWLPPQTSWYVEKQEPHLLKLLFSKFCYSQPQTP